MSAGKGKIYIEVDATKVRADLPLCCNVFVHLPRNRRMLRIRVTGQYMDEHSLALYRSRGHEKFFILDPEHNPTAYEWPADPGRANPLVPRDAVSIKEGRQEEHEPEKAGDAIPEPPQAGELQDAEALDLEAEIESLPGIDNQPDTDDIEPAHFDDSEEAAAARELAESPPRMTNRRRIIPERWLPVKRRSRNRGSVRTRKSSHKPKSRAAKIPKRGRAKSGDRGILNWKQSRSAEPDLMRTRRNSASAPGKIRRKAGKTRAVSPRLEKTSSASVQTISKKR